jgi:hypothetical protein
MADYFITVTEVMELLHIKEAKAYQLMRQCNDELKAKGYMTVRGRCPRAYLLERVGIGEVVT